MSNLREILSDHTHKRSDHVLDPNEVSYRTSVTNHNGTFPRELAENVGDDVVDRHSRSEDIGEAGNASASPENLEFDGALPGGVAAQRTHRVIDAMCRCRPVAKHQCRRRKYDVGEPALQQRKRRPKFAIDTGASVWLGRRLARQMHEESVWLSRRFRVAIDAYVTNTGGEGRFPAGDGNDVGASARQRANQVAAYEAGCPRDDNGPS